MPVYDDKFTSYLLHGHMKNIININILVLSALVFLCGGCASYPVNSPLKEIDADAGYRVNTRTLGEKNSDELFVILGLSGGGMRAAALDYGVLKYLEQIQFGADDRSLLDEIA